MGDPVSSPTTAEVFRRYVAPTYGRFPLTFVRGQGAWLWDEEGRRYLDFGSGVAVCSLGHCPPALARSLQEQAHRLIHCSNLYMNPWQGELARRLCEEVMRAEGKVFFSNSGAEANEVLFKLARRFGHARPRADGAPRSEILTFERSFHGRTLAGISATGQEKVKHQFAPLVPGFRHLPYGDLAALEEAVSPDTVAVMVEVVQGEGGIHVASPGFLEGIAELCRRRDLLLLLDEIQCGLGRAGAVLGWESVLEPGHAFRPDAVSWAKGLASGFPLGAAWMSDRPAGPGGPPLSGLLGPGSHGTTYGGSPLACAAGLAVLEEILGGGLSARAAELGRFMVEELRAEGCPLIRQVRGAGLMIGVELDVAAVMCSPGSSEAGGTAAAFFIDRLHRAGLLAVPAGPDVVRLLPPLILSREEAETGLRLFREVCASLAAAA